MGLGRDANESRAIGAGRAVVIVRVANHDGVLCGVALSDQQLPQTSGFIRRCPHRLNKELRKLPLSPSLLRRRSRSVLRW